MYIYIYIYIGIYIEIYTCSQSGMLRGVFFSKSYGTVGVKQGALMYHVCSSIHIYIYIYTHTYIYIYIYIRASIIYYIYIYIHILYIIYTYTYMSYMYVYTHALNRSSHTGTEGVKKDALINHVHRKAILMKISSNPSNTSTSTELSIQEAHGL